MEKINLTRVEEGVYKCRVPAGNYTYKVSKDGYKTVNGDVSVVKKEKKTIVITLGT